MDRENVMPSKLEELRNKLLKAKKDWELYIVVGFFSVTLFALLFMSLSFIFRLETETTEHKIQRLQTYIKACDHSSILICVKTRLALIRIQRSTPRGKVNQLTNNITSNPEREKIKISGDESPGGQTLTSE